MGRARDFGIGVVCRRVDQTLRIAMPILFRASYVHPIKSLSVFASTIPRAPNLTELGSDSFLYFSIRVRPSHTTAGSIVLVRSLIQLTCSAEEEGLRIPHSYGCPSRFQCLE